MTVNKVEFSFIYAYRNREPERIKATIESLSNQKIQNFEVLFIDYGSLPEFAEATERILSKYPFATYYYVAHKGLLWCKSKAINYGITRATKDQIFISDTDLLFREDFTKLLQQVKSEEAFSIFKIAYLSSNLSIAKATSLLFDKRPYSHIGDTFGVALFPKHALIEVRGLDTFFHFYGSEDSDLNARLLQAGYKQELQEGIYLQHIWHPRYPQKSREFLTVEPRLKNILRINQAHFLESVRLKRIKSYSDNSFGYTYNLEDYKVLLEPTYIHHIENIAAALDHFCHFELDNLSNHIVKLSVQQGKYYKSLKYYLKKLLRKETQLYINMKEVNDRILQCILFRFRDYNYKYVVHENLKQIDFVVDLRKKV